MMVQVKKGGDMLEVIAGIALIIGALNQTLKITLNHRKEMKELETKSKKKKK